MNIKRLGADFRFVRLTIMLALSMVVMAGYGDTILHNFGQGSDGWGPISGLIQSGSYLYGATLGGGSNQNGTIFVISTDGNNYQRLHDIGKKNEGSEPASALLLVNNVLYGTLRYGSVGFGGGVFSVHTDGAGFSNIYNFTADSGAPSALVTDGNLLYGSVPGGGSDSAGLIYSIRADGSGFTPMHSFVYNHSGTNVEGTGPTGRLVYFNSTLYGSAAGGGKYGNGTIFSLNTINLNFQVLHTFTAIDYGGFNPTNIDGAQPQELSLLNGTLYGTANFGGFRLNQGTFFSLSTTGSNFQVLHYFGSYTTQGDDGWNPNGPVLVVPGFIFGSTFDGVGSNFNTGTVFASTTSGQNFTIVTGFNGATNDGSNPIGPMVLNNGSLFGTLRYGGRYGFLGKTGVIFKVPAPFVPIVTPVSVSGVGFNTNGFGFSVSKDASATVVVSESTNLSDWINLQTNGPGDSTFYFNDPTASQINSKFYRTLQSTNN